MQLNRIAHSLEAANCKNIININILICHLSYALFWLYLKNLKNHSFFEVKRIIQIRLFLCNIYDNLIF